MFMLSLLDPSALAPPPMPTLAVGACTHRGVKREASLKTRTQIIDNGMHTMRERMQKVEVSKEQWATLRSRLEVVTDERGILAQDVQTRVTGTCMDFECELARGARFVYDSERFAAPIPRYYLK